MSNVGAELAFVLPKNEVGKFPPLLSELDANKKALGISSYGVAVTTLEDVFLRVCVPILLYYILFNSKGWRLGCV